MHFSTRARRTRLTGLALIAGIVLAMLPAAGAAAQESETYPLVFPVDGPNHYTDTYGAPRSGNRSHLGVDIMADKMIPVLAAASGTVGWIHDDIGGNCCAMELEHDDGWASRYIHLNNDTPGTDDGLGWGFAPGIESGVHVEAGQLIGYVGDSGNAENSGPHLHFELRMPGGTPTNPYPHVHAADPAHQDPPGDEPPVEEPPVEEPPVEEPPPAQEPPIEPYGQFVDIADNTHRDNIVILADEGVTKGCNPPANDRYCPDRQLTRGEMTAFLRRILGLPATDVDYFADDAGNTFEQDINALYEAGVAFGCTATDYCPDRPLRRAEMAEMMTRAFGYESDGTDYFTDDDGHRFEASINAMKAHGITIGCNPPDNTEFCPGRSLIRGEMATFIVRALGLA